MRDKHTKRALLMVATGAVVLMGALPVNAASIPNVALPTGLLDVGSPGSGGPTVIRLHADRPVHEDLTSLTSNATDIVVASVTKVVRVDQIGERQTLPFTLFELQIEQTLQGSAEGPIRTYQVGEVTPTRIVRAEDDPPMEVGQRALLFLFSPDDGTGSPLQDEGVNLYRIVGGPQGRFLVADDTVYSLDTVEPEAAWLPVKARGTPLPVFAEEVRASA